MSFESLAVGTDQGVCAGWTPLFRITLSAQHVDRRTIRLVFWTLLAVALLLPWGTGAAVKIYLDVHGQSTYPWLYYVNPWTLTVYVIPSSLFWSSPLIALVGAWRLAAGIDRLLATTPADRLIILVSGFLLGAIGATRLYLLLFWDLESSSIPAGRLPLLYLPWMLIGLGLGCVVVLARAWKRARHARVPLT